LRNSTPKNETKPLDYADRINRAINFVLNNMDRPIRLEQVARVACFSPFHFHRIFRSLIGESLNEFVKRVRLERATRDDVAQKLENEAAPFPYPYRLCHRL
jgi:AraC family transcriptional regulator